MRGTRATMFIWILVVSVGHAQSLSAQAPTRDGFFIGFGFGFGSLGIEDATERESSISGYFKIGGKLSDRVLLGAESSAWVKKEAGVERGFGAVNAVTYVYPTPDGGFFLKGGLGRARLTVDAGVGGSASDAGYSFTAGAGFDIGFGGRFGLTPYADFLYGSFDGGSRNLMYFGLGVSWY